MSRLFFLSPLWACLVLVAPAFAQNASPPVPALSPEVSAEPEVALDELIRRALQNNLQLPVARENLEAARQRADAARAPRNPVLQIVPGIGSREARDEEIILSQPLDVFGRRRARAAVAGAELRVAQAQNTSVERSLVVAVKNAAAELFAAQEAENLGRVQLEVAQLFRAAAARRAELGDVPSVQVQRAELELLRVQNEFENAQSERLARRAALNQLVGDAPATPLRVALPISTVLADALRLRPASARLGESEIPAPLASLGNSATPPIAIAPQTPLVGGSSQAGSDLIGLGAQFLPDTSQRPDILGAQATLEARRAQVQVLRSERRPNIEVQVRRNAVTGSASTALRAVIVIPLFDFGSNRGERRALEAQARGQEAQIALLRAQAGMQVEQALVRLRQQRATVERLRTGIVPLTLELLRKSQIGYAAGASTYLEVLDAQRTLRAVQTEYLQALVGTRTGEAALESALGAAPLPNLLNGIVNPTGAAAPPGTAAPGTVPEGVIPPNTVEPLGAPRAPLNTIPATPQGGANR